MVDLSFNDLQLAGAVLHFSQERGDHLGRATVEKIQRRVKSVDGLVGTRTLKRPLKAARDSGAG